MRFKYTILYVENVGQTLSFYQQVFGFPIKRHHESGDYGELDTGTTTLSFASIDLMSGLGKSAVSANPEAPSFEIAIEMDKKDMAGVIANAIEAGAKLVQEIREESWGQTTAYVCDPNGVLIEICSPVKGNHS